jgi:hypothetical protein
VFGSTFVNVMMYAQHNNNMIISKKMIREAGRGMGETSLLPTVGFFLLFLKEVYSKTH